MKLNCLYCILFFNSVLFVYPIVQKWNLVDSSIDLLANSDDIYFKDFEGVKDDLLVELYKSISKENGSIVYRKYLKILKNNYNIFEGEVYFDKIESFYYLDNYIIVCPKGKYHPAYFYDNQYSNLSLPDFEEKGDWELKCYYHESGYFIVFYLMNKDSQFFYEFKQNGNWIRKNLHEEIYDFKLNNGIDLGSEYPFAYIIKQNEYIRLTGAKLYINIDGIFHNDCGGSNLITEAKKYSRGCFENDYDHFYFFTYTNVSDFTCVYFDSSVSIDYLNVGQYSTIKHPESPLEFFDEVEIKEMKFIGNYKYVYYTIYNKISALMYHGIIDIKKNLVVFNTDEEILTFIPYTEYSMLAITQTNAYEVCVIKKDGVCIDSYGCTENNYNYILDINGNKCSDECDDGKFFLFKENFCSNSCDESVYIIKDNRCGFCKDYYPDRPYKLINAPNCFSCADIPEGSEIYNSKFYLLKCKSGYLLGNGTCIPHCHENCQTCSEYSEDINSQKCLTCKPNFILDNNNCIFPPTTIPMIIPTTIPIIIPKEIPTTIPSTIPNAAKTNIPTTIPKITKTTIIVTIPTSKSNHNYYNESIIENNDISEDNICSMEEIINDTCIEGKMNLSDIDNIKNYLKNKMSEDNDDAMRTLKTGNVIIQLGTLDEQKDSSDKEVSNIDLGECENKLRTEYNISDNISLIVYKVDIKNSDLTATYVQYEVYHPITKIQLNMSICNEMKIVIDTPVDIGNKMEELYNSLSDSGYNLFNSNDSFYQDICSTYTTLNGTDMLLSDRKKDIYSLSSDVSMCQTGCTLVSYNSETKKAKCNCNIEDTSSSIMNLDIDLLFNKNEIKNSFYDTLSNSNFRVLSCYKSVFSSNILKNIGEIFMSAITFLFLGFNIFSFIIYEQRIKSYILNIVNTKGNNINSNNEKKIKTKEIKNKIDNTQQTTNNVNNNESKKKKGKKKKKKKKKSSSVIQFPPKKAKNNDKQVIINELTFKNDKNYSNSKSVNNETNNKNKISVYESIAKESVVTEKNFIENPKENNGELENIENIKIENLNDQEINDLKYELAVEIDKRTYFEYYWSLLKKKQLILFTFWPTNDYNIYTIKISLFLLSFGLYFTINGFFFTDNTMHKLYVNQGKYNIILQLPQILFSTVISTVINVLLKMLSLTEKNILSLKQEKEAMKIMDKTKSIGKCLRLKFIIYFTLSIIFMLFFWYFISCFCAVYKNTQIVLIKDTLVSFALSMVYPFLLNLLPGLFRIPALRAVKKDKGYKYKISQYMALI